MDNQEINQAKPAGATCPQCGTPLPAGSLAGLCPVCLLKLGAARDTAGQPEVPPFVPPALADVARLFPTLEIIKLVGSGGMGAVYQARQPALDRMVALKVLPVREGADPGYADRFAREARALARLSHPSIVAVYEYGQAGGLHYFLMEFVDGVTLRQLEQAGRLSPREALGIVPQLCDALQYAHDHGVVHRDIKPENVLVDRQGRVKIADFGLVKLLGEEPGALRLTGASHVVGTPHYMSPEQVEHPADVDHRADIYSLGVVFYEMLTGELPLGRFPPPSNKVQIDVRLDDIVLRTLEKEPGRRYQHVSEVKTRLESLDQAPPPPAAPLPPRRPAKLTAGWKWALLVAAVLLLLTLVGAVLGARALLAAREARLAEQAAVAQVQAQRNDALTELRARAAAWSPSVPAGGGIDGQQVLQEARGLIDKSQFDEALLRFMWCFEHAREYGLDSSGVRLLWGYADWIELGRRYPLAKAAFLDLRDRDARELTEGRGGFVLFMELQNMNQYLQADDATVALFKRLHAQAPALAQQCFFSAEGLLVQHGEYELCLHYLPDPKAAFAGLRRQREMLRGIEARNVEIRKDQAARLAKMHEQHPEWPTAPAPPGPPLLADSTFVTKTCQLIEVLVATGHDAEADQIQADAVAVLDDGRLKTAVADARKKLGKGR